jgi:hypothetical protein
MGQTTQVAFVIPTQNSQELYKNSSEESKAIIVGMFRFAINGHAFFYKNSGEWDRKQYPGASEIWNYIVNLELKSTGNKSKQYCYVELGIAVDDVTIIGDLSKFDLVYQKIIVLPDIGNNQKPKHVNYDEMMEAA